METTLDQELIEHSLSGRTEAFGLLVNRYQPRLYRALVNVLGSREDALDVSQDAFVQAYQKLSSFRGDSAFYSWLFRIAMNAAVSTRRRGRKPSASIELRRELAGEEPIDGHVDRAPEHGLEQLERQQLVQRALSSLSEEYRTPLILKEMDGMRYEEIAEVLDCPLGTVRSRIHRGRTELREKLRILLQSEV